MNCPACQNTSTSVLDSRPTPGGEVRRRRQCKFCDARFTTYERVDMSARVDPLELAVVDYIRNLNATTEEMTPYG